MLECVAQFLRKTSKSLGPLCLATGIPMLVQMISAHPIRPAYAPQCLVHFCLTSAC